VTTITKLRQSLIPTDRNKKIYPKFLEKKDAIKQSDPDTAGTLKWRIDNGIDRLDRLDRITKREKAQESGVAKAMHSQIGDDGCGQ